jgi:hypothetical protein
VIFKIKGEGMKSRNRIWEGLLLCAATALQSVTAAELNVPEQYTTIQAALDAAESGDVIQVASGTYAELLSFNGKDVDLVSIGGAEQTIINAPSGTAVTIGPNGSITGFTIRHADGAFGPGMQASGTGSYIGFNIIESNSGGTYASGIGGNVSSPTIDSNVFHDNTGSQVVAFVNGSSPYIANNLFYDNTAAAIKVVAPISAEQVIINNTIVRNSTGIYLDRRINISQKTVRNNILVDNTVGVQVVFGSESYNPTWENNLVYGNGTDYSGMDDQTGSSENISVDPLFVDATNNNFRLMGGSPAIDAGSNADAPELDYDGNIRPFDGDGNGTATVDIGAYETAVISWTPDSADHFNWEPIGTNQAVGIPFAVAISAMDGEGQLLTNYTGVAQLFGNHSSTLSDQNILGDVSHTASNDWDSGTYTFGYSITPSIPLTVTHVRHYFGSKVSIWTSSGDLLVSQNVESSPGSWKTTELAAPVELEAGVQYVISAYTDNGPYYSRETLPDSFAYGTVDDFYLHINDEFPVATGWDNYLPLLDLSYSVVADASVSLTPTNAANFVAGVWTGSVTVLEEASNMVLRVTDDSGVTADSNEFDAQSLKLSVMQPESISEGDGEATVLVAANFALSTDTLISVATDSTNDLQVPLSVLLSSGQTNVTFEIEAVDDALLDGTVEASVFVSATNYASDSGTILVHDNETATLTLSLPQTTTEGVASIAGAVQLNVAPDVDVTVELLSNNENEISSGRVVIAAGEMFASFSLPVVDDTLLDGIQTATITAYVQNWQSGSASVFVMDNETMTMELQLPSSLTEGEGTITNGGTLSLSASTTTDINVLLTSSDSGELEVPGFVIIPAGANQVAFDVSVIDDAEMDGTTDVSVLAQAPGYIPANANVTVVDNDLHHFLVEGVTNVSLFGSANITISAVSIDDTLIDGFAESISLTASGDRGDVVITPATLTNMVGGTVSATVSFKGIGTDVTLTATAGDITGTSALFNVEGSQLVLTPASLTNTLVVAGESLVRTMVISNAGNVDLEYEIEDVRDDVEVPIENLVLNGDFESGNTDFTSGYVYTSEGSSAQGIYTVGDDPTSWFSTISEMMTDHTSGSGQMLIANANSSGSDVVWQQDIDVTAGASYELSLWVAGLQGGVLPSFDIQVAGSSIGSVSPSEMSVWTEFTNRWTATESGTVTLSINNTQHYPAFVGGLYFTLDDIELVQVGVEGEASDSGPVAYYPFNGDASDESGNGYDGTVTGATLTTNRFGDVDGAYYFDGIDDRIDLPSETLNFERTNAFSQSLWIKTSDDDTGNIILAKMTSDLSYRGSCLTMKNGLLSTYLINNGTTQNRLRVDGTTLINDDQWHHLVVTYDGSSVASGVAVYLDGSLENSVIAADTLTGTILNSVTPTIGSRSSESYYEGSIDDIRIYSRTLSAAEVQELYTESESAGSEEPAVESAAVYYAFNGDATDESGNGNDGIVEGATLMEDRFGNPDQAFRFDVGNYIRTADGAGSADITGVITMAAWINPEQFATKSSDPGVVRTILRKRSQYNSYGYTLGITTAGQMTVAFGNSSNSGMAKTASNMDPLPTNTWSHVAVTYDASQIRYYVNGVLVDTQAYSQPLLSTTETLCIGRLEESRNQACFYGGIDEVYLFDRVLTETEVQSLYAGVSDDGEEEDVSGDSGYWLSADPLMGTVPAGSNVTVSVTFDAAGLVAGEQLVDLMMLMCNDQATPTVPVDVSMVVISATLEEDADDDGIPDGWETQYFGVTGVVNPDGDSDGDGQSDYDEYVAGMDPTSSASCFIVNEAYAPTNGQFVIYWNAVSGRVYSIEWTSAVTNSFELMATDLYYPQNSYTDTLHQAEDSGFYKVEVEFE